LNQIEHEILRKKYQDPRIHFAIVCASIGCPKLESSAFYASDLHQRLEQAALYFISDSKHVKLNKNEKLFTFHQFLNGIGKTSKCFQI
jgi:hypothetical protein